jgi:hypothetical protein
VPEAVLGTDKLRGAQMSFADPETDLKAFVDVQPIARRASAGGEEHRSALLAGIHYGIERRLGEPISEGTPLRDRMNRWPVDGGDTDPRGAFLTGYYLSASVPIEIARAIEAKRIGAEVR